MLCNIPRGFSSLCCQVIHSQLIEHRYVVCHFFESDVRYGLRYFAIIIVGNIEMLEKLFVVATSINREDNQLQEWSIHLFSVLCASDYGRNAVLRHLTALPYELAQ